MYDVVNCLGKVSTDYQPLLSLHSRAKLLENGSIWLEAVNSQDEGHYLCRATNGIGAGLVKVIYVGVNGKINRTYLTVLI